MLTEKQIESSQDLPDNMEPISLSGTHIILKPLDLKRDSKKLYTISNGSKIEINEKIQPEYDADELIWKYMSYGPFSKEERFEQYLNTLIDTTVGAVFCVFDSRSGKQVGVTTFMNNFPRHLKIEIGNIWYSPISQRTYTNTEAIYLMLEHAFKLGYRRVEWKCDANNSRSRKAALRLGFKFEGIQEYHLIVKGKNRDTAWYRILDSEWKQIKSQLEGILYAR